VRAGAGVARPRGARRPCRSPATLAVVIVLAFDTATSVVTAALTRDGEVLGERVSRPVSVLEDADALLAAAGLRPADLGGVAVGIGPGRLAGVCAGLPAAGGRSLGSGDSGYG